MSTFGIGPISIAGLVSTSDDVTLTMKLTALDPSKFTVPTEIAAPARRPATGDSPSFKTSCMPALAANCASCHNAGEVGAAHWKLDTAGDAATVSDGIGTVVEAGYMPPWPASDVGVPLAHSKQLDAEDDRRDRRGPRPAARSTCPRRRRSRRPRARPAPPPRKDVVLKMPEAYTGSLSDAERLPLLRARPEDHRSPRS